MAERALRWRDHGAAALVAAWRSFPWPRARGRTYFKEKLRRWLGGQPRPMQTAAGWLSLELAGDILQERLFFSGHHDETALERWLLAHWESFRGATLLDIGGHVGYWSMFFARAVGPNGRVLTFEPQVALAEAIRSAARWNELGWLEVFPMAIGATSGTLALSRPADRGRTSAAPVPGGNEWLEVPMSSLDDFCGDHGLRPDWLKIDIEGAEVLALAGMTRILREVRPRLLCEIHPRQIADLGSDQQAVIKTLRDHGYRLEAFAPEPRTQAGAPARAVELLPLGSLATLPQVSAWHLLGSPE